MIEVRFSPTATEQGQVQLYLQRNLLGPWYWLWVFGLAASLGAASFGLMILYALASGVEQAPARDAALWAISILLLGLAAALILRSFVQRALTRAFYLPDTSQTGERIMRFDEAGVTCTAPFTIYRAAWHEVQALVRTQTNLLVIIDAGLPLFVPCRTAASPDDLENLWQQLELWHQAAQKS